MRKLIFAAAAALAFAPGTALAGCPDSTEIQRVVSDWTSKTATKSLSVTNLEDAVCARKKLIEQIGKQLGPVVGYKAGLTAKPVQERFGMNAPVSGILLAKMILEDGATVPAAFGAIPVWEADMLLVVKDEGINEAKTPEQVLQHLRGWRPFIELPDLVLAPTEKMNGIQLAALNVGARFGVAGAEIPLPANAETVAALAAVKIAAKVDDKVTAENTGAAVLGNPLNVVIWLRDDLKAAGYRLKAGDLISVGSISPLSPPKPGQTITITNHGLVKPASVRVKFQ